MKISSLSLSIVIPVFNEEKRLPKTFDELEKFFDHHSFRDMELIFVDDGSSDRTVSLIKQFKPGYPVKLLSYTPNRGKGYAVREGMLAARNEYCLMLDADMSTPLSELHKIVPLMEQSCPVIIGTRKVRGANVTKRQAWHRQKLGEVYTLLANLIMGVRVSDFTCGFKCFSRNAVEQIFPLTKIDRWSYDAELLFLAHRCNLTICEVPVTWRNDEDTRVRLGKDIWGSFVDLLKIRFGHR